MAEKKQPKAKTKEKDAEQADEDVIMSIRLAPKIKQYLQDLKEDGMYSTEVDMIRRLIVDKWRETFGKGSDELGPLIILLKQLRADEQALLVKRWLDEAKEKK